MIKFEEFYFDSRDKETKIHALRWIPNQPVRFVLQIIHDFAEHMGRYDEFARFMAAEGVLVTGCDHLGHGKTANSAEDLGYISKEDGATILVRDAHRLKKFIQSEYEGLPYFILGCGAGSYVLRNYIYFYGKGIDGAIIAGTGDSSNVVMDAGMYLTATMANFRGWNYRSSLVERIYYKGFDRKILGSDGKQDWRCSNPDILKKYREDSRCGFCLTLNGYHELFHLRKNCNTKENLDKIPLTLPLLFLGGSEDPAGDYGEGLKRVQECYLTLGMEHADCKIYEGDRHEILNEENRFEIYEDIYQWMKEGSIDKS